MVQRKDVKTEDIVRLYHSGLIGREIAEELDCSVPLVQQRLAKAGIKMRPSNDRIIVPIDETVLKEMYWDRQMHPAEIGKELGIHKNTVHKKMREFGISTRSKSEARRGHLNPLFGVGHTKATREKMSNMFLTGERSLDAIKANQFGKKMEYKGIVFRSSWEYGFALLLEFNGVPWSYEPQRLSYRFKGLKKTYIPDFYLPEGWGDGKSLYVEIKGYGDKQEHYKLRAIRRSLKNLVVLYREDLIELGIIDSSGALRS